MTWYDAFGAAYYIFVTVVAIGILMENRNPMKTMGYVLVLYLVPFGGLFIYFMFGQNYRKRKLFSRKGIRDSDLIRKWEGEHLRLLKEADEVTRHYLHERWKIINVLVNSDKTVLTTQNSWKLLRNGSETFPELLRAISEAKHHVHVEYYIVEDDEVGRAFRDALVEAAKRGVEIRFIYDDVGSRGLKRRFIRPLEEAGAIVKAFRPVFFPWLTSKANYRDHRKVIVVDGLTGFTGGINISSRYLTGDEDLGFWRDTHLKIEGDAVKSLQLHFFLMWRFVNQETPKITSDYFPEVQVDDVTLMQIAASGPDSDWATILSAIFTAINSAQRRILITTPYFIPNEEVRMAIQNAAMCGIDVQMILPAESDSKLVQAAMMSYVRELLNAGVKVFLYKKGFIHSKTMVVDDDFCTVGTANMDYRSFDINFEINAFIYDPEVVMELSNDFKSDLAECDELTLDRWDKRRFRRRITESFARLVAPLL